MTFYSEIKNSLLDLEGKSLKRSPLTISSSQNAEILINGLPYVCFCSNNYLGLANHSSISSSAISALQSFGFGSSSSRLVSGTMDLHRSLEERICRFLGFDRSLLFSSGYCANIGTIQSLFDSSDVIFSDRLNHASIIDGCRLSRSRLFIYDHLDISQLRSLLSQNRCFGKKALVVTESVFSMNGDIAPLKDLRSLCYDFDAALMVDEAHSLGVFGPRGTGLCLSSDVDCDIFIGTFSKAFGCFGAFVSSSNEVISLIENRARSFVFSTSPPVSFAAAAISSIDLVESSDTLRSRLFFLSSRLRRSLTDLGYRLIEGSSPIIPVLFGDPKAVIDFSSALFERGFFVQGIRPPSVPVGSSRLRIIPIATHTDRHIESLIDSFRSLYPLYSAI